MCLKGTRQRGKNYGDEHRATRRMTAAHDTGCNTGGGRAGAAQRTSKSLGHGAAAQLAGNGDDLTEGNRAAVLDVLHLLAVTGGLLQRAQHEGGGAGAHFDGGVAVLAGKLASDRQTLPVLGSLLDIITDLLG